MYLQTTNKDDFIKRLIKNSDKGGVNLFYKTYINRLLDS